MNLLLVTQDPMFRQRLESGLGDNELWMLDVCESADIAHEMLQHDQEINLLMIDFSTPGMSGLRAVENLARSRQDLQTILFIPEANDELARQAVKIGVRAAVPITVQEDALPHIFALVSRDYDITVLPHGSATQRSGKSQDLSRRELQILTLLCDGQQNKEIAHAFGIQEVTVKMHMRAIIRKLNARNRTHAAMIARDRGLI